MNKERMESIRQLSYFRRSKFVEHLTWTCKQYVAEGGNMSAGEVVAVFALLLSDALEQIVVPMHRPAFNADVEEYKKEVRIDMDALNLYDLSVLFAAVAQVGAVNVLASDLREKYKESLKLKGSELWQQ